jgi:hypothetical protein
VLRHFLSLHNGNNNNNATVPFSSPSQNMHKDPLALVSARESMCVSGEIFALSVNNLFYVYFAPAVGSKTLLEHDDEFSPFLRVYFKTLRIER